MMPAMIIIAGPTAAGKTQTAIEWALQLDAEIINADATLVYRGMDVGTAKPTLQERRGVVHHLIDVVSVRQSFCIKDFVEHAQTAVKNILGRGKRVIVVGGSGFYLKSFFAPVIDDYPISPKIITAVEALYAAGGIVACLERLQALNPQGLGDLDVCNPRRIIRALQRCLISGKTLAELKAQFDAKPCPFAHIPKKTYLINRPRTELIKRIEARAAHMLDNGLIQEVQVLLNQGLRSNLSASHTIGYREVIEYLDNKGDITTLREHITRHTIQLVKKQLTFFKHQIAIDHELDGDSTHIF